MHLSSTRRRSLHIFVIWLLFTAAGGAEKPSPAARLEWWIQDLEFFARTFPAKQVDFPKLYDRARFRKEIDNLELAIPRISDSEIVLRLMRLVASAKVSHTRVYPQEELEFHHYPVRFFWCSDGATVISAAEQYKPALGARIVRIGPMTPEQLEAAISPFVPHENQFWLHAKSPDFMLTREVADHFGLAKPDGSIELTLLRRGSQPFKVQIAPSAGDTSLISLSEALKLPTPLFRKRPDDFYWYEYLAGSHALYIQYTSCQNDPKKPFKDFAQELFGFIDGLQPPQQVERVIIDLRNNSGGDSSVINPLLQGLRSRPHLSEPGRLYTLISKNTFSSGMMNAVELRKGLHAILVGEPSGGAPNEYGEVRSFVLPNSNINITYATKYFRLLEDSNPSAVYPDLTVYRTTEDLLTSRDPALETALKHAISVEKRSASK